VSRLAGHLEIEEEEVRLEGLYEMNCFDAIPSAMVFHGAGSRPRRATLMRRAWSSPSPARTTTSLRAGKF